MSAGPFLAIRCPYCGGSGAVAALTMGQRIRALRTQAGFTQAELAARVGGLISEKNLGSVEQGNNLNPPLTTLRALAKALGVTVGYLVDGDDPLS